MTTGTRHALRLLISGPDRPGIISGVTGYLYRLGADVTSSDQYTSAPGPGTFFQRLAFTLPAAARGTLVSTFGREVAEPFGLTWRLVDAAQPKRVAILASKADHCLVDLLWRMRRDELPMRVELVAANHPDLRATVEQHGIPFHHVPSVPGKPEESESRLADLLGDRCDLIVLARYMQVLTGEFLTKVAVPLINIHHSVLPAFAGAQPYTRAYERGVKLIGATAHYVTEELDCGPIIEQDVARASHRDDAAALARLGADVERTVLARAVRWHCEDRLLRHGNRVLVLS
ncbi:formyltetrahydrofolate deformylase [Paractinoplanes brasiliensis]|uniref:Formyltetrahydrofolate deformylase n=1 Tax=Paractinoplanes brasiliensis TaxID=52695 RepID=A0A4R6JYV4_9ACTN|nr:formyltetrahydrofolate deformylase [Actinoplanes brasiliensis]TDO42030.1 formyltetrahydrofolate deformylase [Actinoplanes brasiliensis]GID33093.1 formyltetrahydrofolate deformylase [Actinoplanes brasiliensis]